MPPALARQPSTNRLALTTVALSVVGATALLLLTLLPLRLGLQLPILACLSSALLLGRLILRRRTKFSHTADLMNDPTDQNKPRSPTKHGEYLADSKGLLLQMPTEPCTESPPAQVLLITKHSAHRQFVVTNLQAWGRSCNVVESCVEAICHLLNQVDQGSAAQTKLLIVDAEGLELEASRIASLLRNEPRLSQIRLLCLKPLDHAETAQQLLQSGYAGLIDLPIEKSQLFTAVEGNTRPSNQADNVIDLGQRRQGRSRTLDRKTILLAEPNASERSRLQRQLDKAGHRVMSVENGEQALDALELRHFDIAVINLQLPIMNGMQVIKLHRFTTPHKLWVPFIALTDQNTPTTLKLCRELQIKACLFKPVPAAELLKMVAAAPSKALTAESNTAYLSQTQEPRFLHADLLDRRILQALEQLDGDQDFVPELIEIFIRESVVIQQEMQLAIQCGNHTRFLEQCQIMLDNAGQLGAFALYEMCLALMLMDQKTFETSALQRQVLLATLVSQTLQAFQDYLADTQNSQTDRS